LNKAESDGLEKIDANPMNIASFLDLNVPYLLNQKRKKRKINAPKKSTRIIDYQKNLIP